MYFSVLCFCKVYICPSFCIFFETFVLGHDLLRPLWPFDHVLDIMLCVLCLFVLMYDIGILLSAEDSIIRMVLPGIY